MRARADSSVDGASLRPLLGSCRRLRLSISLAEQRGDRVASSVARLPLLARLTQVEERVLKWGPRVADRRGGPMPNRFDDDREGDDRRTAALMGLAIVLSLAIAGIVLIRDLGKEAKLEDCLMSGRTNCAPIELPAR
jgi:hypothetical protein